jgi:hypothetical protein
MNLKEIKLRFSVFLNQFSKDDIKLLMQFLEMIIDEYNSNPFKLFGLSQNYSDYSFEIYNLYLVLFRLIEHEKNF